MRLRVLVADDHEEWQYILTRTLEAQYDIVGYAERGDQILQLASELHVSVITLDVSMPGQSGLEALPAVRASLPDATIVVVTANASSFYREEALARGADAYITKDRVLSELLSVIDAARNRESRQPRRA